jgi:6-phosphofructokinase 1
MRGVTGKMITLVRQPGPDYACTTGLADLEAIANAQRLLPNEFLTPQGTGVTQAFFEYARPLIGEALPRHVRLKKALVRES